MYICLRKYINKQLSVDFFLIMFPALIIRKTILTNIEQRNILYV